MPPSALPPSHVGVVCRVRPLVQQCFATLGPSEEEEEEEEEEGLYEEQREEWAAEKRF